MATVEAGVIEESFEVGEAVEEKGEELPEDEDDSDQVDGVASMRNLWDDSSKLLFQSGYLKVLKQMALSGQLQQYHIRSVCWRLFLGCLPEDQDQWIYTTKLSRENYTEIKNKYLMDPHKVAASLDVTVNNPLSLDDESPWNQFFQDNELKQTINQDVVRTFPDVQFFRQSHIQSTMLDLLFCYCKEHPDLCYRQGMHELLAPILFVLHSEMRDTTDPSLAPELQYVMDPDYIEHDAYTIFSELMEGMQKWYMSTTLEADYYRARARNNHKKMYYDPRTQKPFEGKDEHTPTSAVSRKLELIHNLLLKKADDVLWLHMRDLAIPAQTYGIRWIRLLFGREFPLPSVLELWDALFVDGTSLSLVDYICVAMLMHIRQVLIDGDYATCMHHLMHFPTVYEVNYLVQRALHLRSPNSFPSPQIWTYHPNRSNTMVGGAESPTNQQPSPQIQIRGSSFQSRASKAKEVLTKQFPKALSRNSQSGPRLEFDSPNIKPRSRSPSPKAKRNQHLTPTDEKLFSGAFTTMTDTSSSSSNSKPKGRFKILGESKSSKVPAGKEMTSNPRVHQETSQNQIEKLTNRLDDVEAKCLYCGGKMESLIDVLQEEITSLSGLEDETENTLLLSLAGLKHVRDLLLNKIPFSGEVASGWEIPRSKAQELNGSINTAVKPSISTPDVVEPADPTSTNSTVSSEDTSKDTTPTNRTVPIPIPTAGMGMKPDQVPHPLETSGNGVSEGGKSGVGSSISEDWVNLSVGSHPLVSSSEAND